jgi:hypothetical protein
MFSKPLEFLSFLFGYTGLNLKAKKVECETMKIEYEAIKGFKVR